MERFGFWENACQVFNGGEATYGMSRGDLVRAADGALLVNISGHLKAEFVFEAAARRAYVDQDPVYTQLWRSEYGKELSLGAHDVFFTVGLNIGTPHSPIPDCGIKWHPMLPPVVTDYWPFSIDTSSRRLTTIASWAGYSDLCYGGEWYGAKAAEFERFARLPVESGQECEVAMRRHERDECGVQLLRDGGWTVTDARRLNDLDVYQQYIARSRGEIGIAKNAYVKGRSGWFSDRASHYLASGKPVLAQGTGFERHVSTGRGIIAFNSMAEAIEGIAAINGDYEAHCRAARAFAEEHLQYSRVLPPMLDACAFE
jgi:hypothetical protein